MRCLEVTDSEGLDVTKAFNHFSIIMNKRKRAARKRRRENETLKVAQSLDSHQLSTFQRVKLHNQFAKRGYGMIVDAVWVREYHESRTILF
jgi:hypothetical protein